MSSLFLIRPDILLDIIGIRDKEKFMYELIENYTQFNKEITLKTFRNFMQGKGNPAKKTIQSLKKDFNIDLESDLFIDMYHSLWHEMLIQMEQKLTFPEDFFPYALSFLKDIAEQEDILIKDMKIQSSEYERLQAYACHPFVRKLLDEQERQTVQEAKNHNEMKRINIFLLIKTLLYVVAAFDVEFGLYYQAIHKEEKYSFIKKILPIYNDKNNLLHPIGRFFANIKKNSKKSFQQMANCIIVKSSEDIKSETQRRKFRYWREGKKIPHVDEVTNMIKALFPQIGTIELDHTKVMFYSVVGISTLFKKLLYATSKGMPLFQKEFELIEWFQMYYNQYHHEHYQACMIFKSIQAKDDL